VATVHGKTSGIVSTIDYLKTHSQEGGQEENDEPHSDSDGWYKNIKYFILDLYLFKVLSTLVMFYRFEIVMHIR